MEPLKTLHSKGWLLSVPAEVTDADEHSSLLWNAIHGGCKKVSWHGSQVFFLFFNKMPKPRVSITTLSITTLSITTLSITTLKITINKM